MNFSKKSTETETYVNDEVSLEIKNDSIDNSGLVLLISNKTNTDLTYDSTYYIEQKKNGVWYSSDNEQYFNALAILLKSKALFSKQRQAKFQFTQRKSGFFQSHFFRFLKNFTV